MYYFYDLLFFLDVYFWTVLIVQAIVFGFATSYIAGQKNKDQLVWFFIGFALGLIGLIIIAVTKADSNNSTTKNKGTFKSGKVIESQIRLIDLESPLDIKKIFISVDESSNIPYLSVLFKNNASQNLSAVKFDVKNYDSFGELIASKNNNMDLVLQDLDVKPNETFGDNVKFSLEEYPATRIADIVVKQISYKDGQVWNRGENELKDISKYNIDGDEDLKLIAGEDAITYPIVGDEFWRCICGNFNVDNLNDCNNCSRNRVKVFNEYNREAVNSTSTKIKEKKEEEKKESIKRSNAKKKNRNRVIIALVVIAISIAGFFYLQDLKSEKELKNIEDLFISIESNDLVTLETLLEEKIDINSVVHKDTMMLPIHLASSKKGGHEAVKLLLENGAEINKISNSGSTPLSTAILSKSGYDMIKLLLDNGADPNIVSTDNLNSLYDAIKNNSEIRIIKLLIEESSDPNVVDEKGNNPLHFAIINGANPEIIKLLMEEGYDSNLVDQSGNNALHLALSNKTDSEIIKLLVDAGTDPNIINKNKANSLRIAISMKYDVDIIEYIMYEGIGIDMPTDIKERVIELVESSSLVDAVMLVNEYSVN